MRLAALLQANGDYEAAVSMLEETSRRHPRHPAVWLALGRLALDRNNPEGALRALEHLDKLPDAGPARQRLAVFLAFHQGKFAEAADGLELLLAAAPDAALLSTFTDASVRAGRSESAIARLRAMIENMLAGISPALPYALLAQVHQASGRLDQAEEAFRQAIAAQPANAATGIRVALARLLVQKNKSEEARTLLSEILAALPSGDGGETVRLALAMTEERLGNTGEALRQYEEILSTNPNSIVAANNLAAIVADHYNDDPDRLMRALNHVNRFATAKNSLQLDTLAWIYYRQGRFKNAHDLLHRADAANHLNAAVRFHYGAVLLALGRSEDGRRLIEKVVQEDFLGWEEARRLLAATP